MLAPPALAAAIARQTGASFTNCGRAPTTCIRRTGARALASTFGDMPPLAPVLAAAGLAAGLAGCAVVATEVEADAAPAHPAAHARRVAVDDRVVGNVPRDHAAGADHAVAAERDAADDGGIGADRGAALHQRLAVLVLALDVAPRVDHVREYHRGPAEHIVLDHHARVNRDVVLDLHVVADHALRRNDHVLADIAASTDAAVAHDVAEVPDPGAGADLGRRVDHGRVVREVAVRVLGCRHAALRNSGSNCSRKAFTLRMTSLLLSVLLANWAVLTT